MSASYKDLDSVLVECDCIADDGEAAEMAAGPSGARGGVQKELGGVDDMKRANLDSTSGMGWQKQRRAAALAAAAICAAALLIALPASASAQDDGREASPITVAAAYRAMAETPADFELLKAGVKMQRAGRSRVDVLAELKRRRDTTRSGFGDDVFGDIGASAGAAAGGVAGVTLGALNPLLPGVAGAAAGGAAGAAAGGVAGAALGRLAGDRLAGAVRARQREAARGAEERPWEAVLFSEEYKSLQAVFRAPTFWGPIWRAVFEPSVKVSLDDDPVNALAKVPEFEAELRDYGVYDDVVAVSRIDGVRAEDDLDGSDQRFLTAFHSAMEKFVDRIDESADAWAAGLDAQGDRLAVREAAAAAEDQVAAEETWAAQLKRDEARQRHARYEADKANLASIAGVALFGLAAVAPDTARGITAFGQAVIDVGDAVDGYNQSIAVGASAVLAGTAMTGNFLFAGISLLSALSPGPTPDELILEQLNKLTEVVRTGFRNVHSHVDLLRRELHARFDAVDRRFEEVDQDLAEISRQIDDVVSLLDEMRAEIRQDFRVVQRAVVRANGLLGGLLDRVADLSSLILGTYGQQSQEHLELRARIDALALQDCPTADAGLEGCLRAFHRVADGLTRLERQPADRQVLVADYVTFPGYTNRIGCGQFATLTDALVECQDVVGARQWHEVVREWNRFLVRHGADLQAYAEQVNQVVDRLTAYQAAHDAFRGAVVDDLRRFQEDGGQNTAFSQLIARAWDAHSALFETVRGLETAFWEEERADGPAPGRLRLRRDDQRSAVPELETDGPYSWRPMNEFYDNDAVPEWLDIRRFSDCEYQAMEDRFATLPGVAGTVKGRFWTPGPHFPLEWAPAVPVLVNDGVLGLLHPDSLMPARLGIGRLSVCARYARGGTRTTRTRLAVQVWFTDTATIQLDETGCSAMLWSGVVEATGEDDAASSLFWRAAVKIRRSPPLIDPTATGDEMSGCQRRYLRAVEAARSAMLRYVADELTGGRGSERATRSALDLSLSSAHLRQWIDVAFGGVSSSLLLDGFRLGFFRLPDLLSALGENAEPAGRILDDTARRIRRIESVLQSPAMRDLVTYGSADRRFTETTVASLP